MLLNERKKKDSKFRGAKFGKVLQIRVALNLCHIFSSPYTCLFIFTFLQSTIMIKYGHKTVLT